MIGKYETQDVFADGIKDSLGDDYESGPLASSKGFDISAAATEAESIMTRYREILAASPDDQHAELGLRLAALFRSYFDPSQYD